MNAICPSYVLTPLVEKQIPETAQARNLTEEQVVRDVLLHAQPTRKFVTVEEIGALAIFLCTKAGASITGAAIPVEGGWTAQKQLRTARSGDLRAITALVWSCLAS